MKKLIVWGIVLFGGSYLGAKFYLHYRVSSDLDNMLVMVSPFADVKYSGISSTMGGTLSIDNIEVTVNGYRDPIRADKISLVTPGFWHLMGLNNLGSDMVSSEIPESLGFSIVGFQSSMDSDIVKTLYSFGQQKAASGVEVDVAAECTGKYGFSPAMLQDLGYKDLIADLYVGYRKNGANMIVDVRTSVKDMYDMNFELTLDGAVSPQAMAMGTYRPKLVDARLEYVDQSLDERTTELCERAGLSQEEVIAAKLDAFSSLGEDRGIVFDDQITAPYKEFIAGKSTFVLTARPNEPVNMSQIGLYKPSDVPALLNLTAVAL